MVSIEAGAYPATIIDGATIKLGASGVSSWLKIGASRLAAPSGSGTAPSAVGKVGAAPVSSEGTPLGGAVPSSGEPGRLEVSCVTPVSCRTVGGEGVALWTIG